MIRTIINRRLDAAERRLGESNDYMRFMLGVSLRAFMRFTKIFAIADYRGRLPADAYHVARIVAARDEDCGSCVQIEVNLAVQAGLARELVQAVIDQAPERLPADVQLVYAFTDALVQKSGEDAGLREAIENRYGAEGLVELSLAIAASRFLPVVKRTLGYGTSCAKMTVHV